ncbi:uncharacterized protein YdaT [Bradyrhizobium sp. F1.13.4]
MERHGRDLEAEAGEQEHETEHQADIRDRRGRRDAGEADRTGEAVDQRGAVEQHARRQRAEHEVLQAGFGRLGVVTVRGRHDVERERHQFEAEIERDQIAGRDQHHHAEGREQHQDRVFEDTARRIREELGRQHQRHRRTDQGQDLHKAGKIIDDEAAAEGHVLARGQHVFERADHDQEQHRKRRDRLGGLLPAIGAEHQECHGSHREHELGQHRRQLITCSLKAHGDILTCPLT